MDINELKLKGVGQLLSIAEERGLRGFERAKKKDLIFKILQDIAEKNGLTDIEVTGILEILNEGFGFLRTPESSYLAGQDDIYVSPNQIRKFNLRKGDTIRGSIRAPKDSERFFALNRIYDINGDDPQKARQKVLFENLTPVFPDQRLRLERGTGTSEDLTCRAIDLISPIGKGQRALIVSPPKAGKTLMMRALCRTIEHNNPEAVIMVLLIDERPEEVTDFSRSVKGEVIASTFDESPSRHVQVADMVIEKAKRMVEHRKDVVVLLDSITRLSRAYNSVQPSSGRVLTGGLDAQALERPKRFFGAARNVEDGGSLTIIASALVDTGSKMDDVIYEEFKGTGNMEVHLDRRLAERRIYPAINIFKSSTRREELLMDKNELQKLWVLRRTLTADKMGGDDNSVEPTDFLINRLMQTNSNEEFFNQMKG